jgi:hypothetical protein
MKETANHFDPMRLLSFFNHVETTLAMLRPEDSAGWRRRVNYQTGEALSWNDGLGLTLRLRVSEVAEERYGLLARWVGPTGAVLQEKTFFCGPSPFDWQTAAEAVAETMPEGVLPAMAGASAESSYEPLASVAQA